MNVLAFPGPRRRAAFPRRVKVGTLRLGAEFALVNADGTRGPEGTVVEEARGRVSPLVVMDPAGPDHRAQEKRLRSGMVVLALGTVSPNFRFRRAA